MCNYTFKNFILLLEMQIHIGNLINSAISFCLLNYKTDILLVKIIFVVSYIIFEKINKNPNHKNVFVDVN
jgi:hypothetical protein